VLHVEASLDNTTIFGSEGTLESTVFSLSGKPGAFFGRDLTWPNQFSIHELTFKQVTIFGKLLPMPMSFTIFSFALVGVGVRAKNNLSIAPEHFLKKVTN